MAYNVIQVSFGGSRKALTAPINYRDDIGQVLKIKGLALPTYYVVDFCNEGDAQTKPMTGTADGVSIPDEFLATGQPIKAYIVLSDENSTQTRYEVTIPVNPRPRRTDIAPTPAEQQAIDELIAAMNDAVEDASDSATAAAGSATDAGDSATAAHNAQIAAETAQGKAETAQGKAEDAQEAAETAQGKAEDAQDAAELAQGLAEDAQAAAEAALAEFTEITVSAETLEPGSSATADYENGHLTLGIPEGEKGDQGDQGVPGQAATIAVGTTTTLQPGADATVQNSGTSSAAVFDFGIPKGAKGDPGTDGVSPTVTVETISGGHEVTITDKNGNHEFNVMDGIDGTTFTPSVSNEGVISWSNDGGKQNPTSVNIKGPKGDTGEVSQAEFETALDNKAPVIIDSASGAIASFPDGADGMPVHKLLVNLSPKQDLHGYDNPWPAGGGANICDPLLKFTAGTYFGVTLSTTDGYNFTLSGTGTESGNVQCPTIPTADCVVYPAGTYTSTGAIFSTYKPDGSWYANRQVGTWTADSDFVVRSAYIQIVEGTTPSSAPRFLSLARGSTALTAWTPYSNECPISGWTGVSVWRTGTNLGIVKNFYVGGASGLAIGGGGVLVCFSAVKGQTYRIGGASGDRNKLFKFRGNMEDIKSGASMSASVSSSNLPYVITADETCIYCYYRNSEWSDTIANALMVVVGDEAQSYEPYQGEEVSVTFPPVNIWDETFSAEGKYINSSGTEVAHDAWNISSYIPVKPDTEYYFKNVAPTATSACAAWYDESKTFISATNISSSGFSLTSPSNAAFLRTTVAVANVGSASVNYPATDHDYHAHTEPMIVYGGTLTIRQDGSGEIECDRRIIPKSEIANAIVEGAGRGCFVYRVADAATTSAEIASDKLLCTSLPTKSQRNIYTNTIIGCAIWWNVNIGIGTGDNSISTSSLFKTWWADNGGDIVYPLATPIVIELDPQQVISTLKGYNAMWANGDSVEVEYCADTKLYIEKLTQPTEDDLIANAPIASGKFFMIGNTLYLSTAAIASGAQITVGTNAVKLSLADALNQINS